MATWWWIGYTQEVAAAAAPWLLTWEFLQHNSEHVANENYQSIKPQLCQLAHQHQTDRVTGVSSYLAFVFIHTNLLSPMGKIKVATPNKVGRGWPKVWYPKKFDN